VPDVVQLDVRELQALLVARNYLPNASEIDGIFGPRTERAVKALQEDSAITVDGIVGGTTWEALLV
jgi:peptidoglycan hydrolase-like protein with peptidoglycan-binding domain